MGNLRSVEKAIAKLGYPVRISSEVPTEGKLIIPGVGAFGAAMECLAPLKSSIRERAEAGMPILGICLGQQLLFDRSEEHGIYQGLGLIPGEVRYFPTNIGLKIPLIGWAKLKPSQDSPLMVGVKPEDQVYFVHSLHTICENSSDVAATATHGIEFVAAVQRGNIWGCQFHPEKSSAVGYSRGQLRPTHSG